MKSHLLTYILIFFLSSVLYSQNGVKHNESYYQEKIQDKIGGETEVSVTSGRVDLVTDTHAYEIERASNWKNSIGQALWYGLQTGKKAGIILLVLDSSQYKYFQQLNSAISHAGISDKIDVIMWPHDFK